MKKESVISIKKCTKTTAARVDSLMMMYSHLNDPLPGEVGRWNFQTMRYDNNNQMTFNFKICPQSERMKEFWFMNRSYRQHVESYCLVTLLLFENYLLLPIKGLKEKEHRKIKQVTPKFKKWFLKKI